MRNTKTKRAKSETAERDVYAFPTRVRCPRCGSIQTHKTTYSHDMSIQYRTCDAAICRVSFKIVGKKV